MCQRRIRRITTLKKSHNSIFSGSKISSKWFWRTWNTEHWVILQWLERDCSFWWKLRSNWHRCDHVYSLHIGGLQQSFGLVYLMIQNVACCSWNPLVFPFTIWPHWAVRSVTGAVELVSSFPTALPYPAMGAPVGPTHRAMPFTSLGPSPGKCLVPVAGTAPCHPRGTPGIPDSQWPRQSSDNVQGWLLNKSLTLNASFGQSLRFQS